MKDKLMTTRRKPKATRMRRRGRAVSGLIIVSLLAAGVILAQRGVWRGSVARSQRRTTADQETPSAAFTPSSPAKEYVYAGGRLLATEEPASSGCGSSPPSPGNSLVATAQSASQVHLDWSASPGADHYEVERSQSPNSFVRLNPNPTTNQFDDFSAAADTAYLYRVRATDASGQCPSGYSNVDLATTVVFVENVVAGVTIKPSHLVELKTAVNAVRLLAGLAAFDWTDAPATPVPTSGGLILKDQMQKLRNNLDAARSALGLTAQSYSNQPLTQGTTIFAAHIQELRNGVK